tara:strand:- start:788 stop:940 length:153 start_codon:yes stop_codon:yes gene_type:complete
VYRRSECDGGGFGRINRDVVEKIAEFLVPTVADAHVNDIIPWIKYKSGHV